MGRYVSEGISQNIETVHPENLQHWRVGKEAQSRGDIAHDESDHRYLEQ